MIFVGMWLMDIDGEISSFVHAVFMQRNLCFRSSFSLCFLYFLLSSVTGGFTVLLTSNIFFSCLVDLTVSRMIGFRMIFRNDLTLSMFLGFLFFGIHLVEQCLLVLSNDCFRIDMRLHYFIVILSKGLGYLLTISLQI